jgi:hypothetical protein
VRVKTSTKFVECCLAHRATHIIRIRLETCINVTDSEELIFSYMEVRQEFTSWFLFSALSSVKYNDSISLRKIRRVFRTGRSDEE